MKWNRIGPFIIVNAVSALLFCAALLGCESNDEEQAVMSVVSTGQEHLENGEAAKAMHLTTSKFLAQPGRRGRTATLTQLSNFYRVHGDIEILHPTPDVEILESGKAAMVSAPFVVAERGVSRDALDALADDPEAWETLAAKYTTVEHAEISLVKENDRWLVSSVRF